MHEEAGAGDIDLCMAQTILDTARQVVRRRQRFAAIHLSVIIDRDEISKRSAYINGDSH
jgi:hypothetical protein